MPRGMQTLLLVTNMTGVYFRLHSSEAAKSLPWTLSTLIITEYDSDKLM
jgi:hypothetical protein